MKRIKLFEGYLLDVRNELKSIVSKRMSVFDECVLTLIDTYDFEPDGVNDILNRSNDMLAIRYEAKGLLYSDELFREIDKVNKKVQVYGAKASVRLELKADYYESNKSLAATYEIMKKFYDKHRMEYEKQRTRHKATKLNITLTISETI